MSSSGISFGELLNLGYLVIAILVAVFSNRIYRSKPIGVWGDVAVAAIGVAAFGIFLGDGWRRMMLEFNDDYPTTFKLAWMPIVAFVSIGFVRSLINLVPERMQVATAAPRTAMPAQAIAGSWMAMTMPTGAGETATMPAPQSEAVSDAPVEKPESRMVKWLKLYASILALVATLIGVAAKLFGPTILPACDSQTARETISEIYKDTTVRFKRWGETNTTLKTDDRLSCETTVTLMDNAQADLGYDIFRGDGGKVQVKITAARDK